VYQKTKEQKDAISEKLNMVFMFNTLDENEKNIIIDAMEEMITEAKEKVINEGDEGDCLYVVGSGTLMC
jgi:cAMP-dependent protein kinase regulator